MIRKKGKLHRDGIATPQKVVVRCQNRCPKLWAWGNSAKKSRVAMKATLLVSFILALRH